MWSLSFIWSHDQEPTNQFQVRNRLCHMVKWSNLANQCQVSGNVTMELHNKIIKNQPISLKLAKGQCQMIMITWSGSSQSAWCHQVMWHHHSQSVCIHQVMWHHHSQSVCIHQVMWHHHSQSVCSHQVMWIITANQCVFTRSCDIITANQCVVTRSCDVHKCSVDLLCLSNTAHVCPGQGLWETGCGLPEVDRYMR